MKIGHEIFVWQVWSSSLPNDKLPATTTTGAPALLFVFTRNLKAQPHGGKERALGYTPGMGKQTYAIYQDESMDHKSNDQLTRALLNLYILYFQIHRRIQLPAKYRTGIY